MIRVFLRRRRRLVRRFRFLGPGCRARVLFLREASEAEPEEVQAVSEAVAEGGVVARGSVLFDGLCS